MSPGLPLDADYVLAHLREQDVTEMLAFGLDPCRDPRRLFDMAACTHVAFVGHRPAFMFGTVELIPGVHQIIGFGTAQTRKAIPRITAFSRNVWIPDLVAQGVRRIQVHIPETHAQSIAWLLKCGLKHECTMKSYAVDGGAVVQLAASQEDLLAHVRIQRVSAAAASSARTGSPD